MIKVGRLSPVLVLLLDGCVLPGDFAVDSGIPRAVPSVTQSAQQVSPDVFWAMIEDARTREPATRTG